MEGERKTLWVWDQSHDEEYGRSSVSVLQLEEVDLANFSIGKSCGILLSKDGKCYQVGELVKSELTLSGIEAALCEVSTLRTHNVKEVACGYHHIALVTESGSAFCWGASDFGQCGVITDFIASPRLVTPSESEKDVKFINVACGKTHTMAISRSHELWGWGSAKMIGGVKVTKGNPPCPNPAVVQHLCGRKVFQVCCGKFHTVALTEKLAKKAQSNTVCAICNQDIFRMYDNDDQVIISDTHTCTCKDNRDETSQQPCRATPNKSKHQTHNRSASLPFCGRNLSPLLARREHQSKTPSLSPLSIPLTSSVSTLSLPEKDIQKTYPELEMMSLPKPVKPEHESRKVVIDNERTDGNNMQKKMNDAASATLTNDLSSIPKSRSIPANLGKRVNDSSSDVPHFHCNLISDEDSESSSEFFPRSLSPSQLSLKECKARMTLPLSSELPVDMDPKSAMKYLEQLSPNNTEEDKSLVQNQHAVLDIKLTEPESTEPSVAPTACSADAATKSFSERITLSITDNQLLSPLTSYSKNVFSGVMDRIEWIKTSTYEKGVAPIRDFLSKEKTSDGKVMESDDISHDDPLRSIPISNSEANGSNGNQLTLHTEVWTWGKNSFGQLGLSDQLDRFQPVCIKSLSSRGIVKISAGANHTVALTSNSEAYSWGCNEHYQLGRTGSNASTPVKIEWKNRVWDVAAGKRHTLFLGDGVSQEPSILVCGSESPNEESHPLKSNDKDKNAWKMRTIEFSHNMRFHSRVISGFTSLSSSITEKSPSSSTIALHKFAKSEREFYQQITLIKTEVLRPLKFSDLCKHLEGSTYGEVLAQILDLFGQLSYSIGLNTVKLTQSVVTGVNCEQETFSYLSDDLFEGYKKYFKSLNDVIAYGFFEKCQDLSAKQCEFLSKPNITKIFKKLLGEKRISRLSSENFLQILQLPAFHLREYATSLNRLATALEENVALSSHLEKLSSKSEELWNDINALLHSANSTRGFWKNEFKSTKLGKLAESLKKVGRYLILNSKKVRLDIAHAGRFSSNWFILFNDCLVLIQSSVHTIYQLETLWCSAVSDSDEKRLHISIITPEEDITAAASTEDAKTKWLTSLNRAINKLLSKNGGLHLQNEESKQFHRSPPSTRNAKHTFTKVLDLKGATYDGAWVSGKPHGKGEMSWNDGRVYKGSFKTGKEDGYGEWKAAPDDASLLKYHGWWKDGKMDGYGKLWYNRYQSYEGSFVSGAREGHGVLRTGSVTEGSVYVGAWKNDKKNGFGSEDDITKGEKYLGMWAHDEKHGVGILVTLDGLYIQSCFSHGNVSGDTLLIEGKHVFEGHVSTGLSLSGKGRLTLPGGDKLEGSFSGFWGENIRFSGNFARLEQAHTAVRPKSPETPIEPATSFTNVTQKDYARSILRRYNRHIMKKLAPAKHGKTFPLTLHPDLKWTALFSKCKSSLKCPLTDGDGEAVDTRKIWDAVSVAMATAKRMREELKLAGSSPQKKADEKKLNWLERVPSVVVEDRDELSTDDINSIKEYLNQAFSTNLHPLGELAESLGNVFRDSYSGAGAHKWLLTQAVADVRSFVRRTYDILCFMFPHLGKEHNASHMKIVHNNAAEENPDDHSLGTDEMVTAGDLLLPVLLPRVYPTLFTLYALRHEAEDKSYWERVSRLNRHPDIALLSFLGVKPKFWLLDDKEIPPLEASPEDGQLYGNIEQAESSKWRHLLVARAKDCSFLSAIETLQLISTTFIPAEKLNVIQSTFKEINATVVNHHKQTHSWSMDDLFPVFQYVVVRARIGHLGCEIQLIEDFLEPDLCKGEKGIMFTTLKACYFQIRVEKNL